MIRNTFSILDGVGVRLERGLWRKGILEWKDFIGAPAIKTSISAPRKAALDRDLMDAGERLTRGDSGYFARALPRKEHWRLYEEFRARAVCLDIETNGWHPAAGGYVTVAGLYDGFDYKAFVRGENLSAPALRRELSRYGYLITFFGSAFDMPFLRETLGVDFEGAHFDLCFGARRLGMKGGLKKIEPLMGINRDESVRGMDGYEAVRLWHEAARGNAGAMDLLITYNREDTVNLMALAGMIYPRLKAQTGIEEYLN
ncbi:MAG: ribonuclease H-like domain-containing protein [Nitrospiraceae bacterium]|nr:ribonuclease H-like domain-containing protein [Nitrospiraceae bacterium]